MKKPWRKWRVIYNYPAPAGNKSVVILAQNKEQIRRNFEDVKTIVRMK